MANTWEPVANRIKAGDFSDLIPELDFAILEILPDFDTNMGGFYQIGETVKQAVTKINKKAGMEVLNSGTCSVRLRFLVLGELARVVKTPGKRSSQAYQKTEKGKEVLQEWLATRQ